MKNVIVFTSLDIYARNSAGAARIINIAKSLALSDVSVYLCSASAHTEIKLDKSNELSKNIYFIGKNNNRKVKNGFIRKLYELYTYAALIFKINLLAKCFTDKPILYLYPTTKSTVDVFSLVYLKFICRYKIYYETNEVRLFGLHNRSFSKKPARKIYELCAYSVDYIKYKIVEKLTKYYDGLLAISKNIEKYFSVYNKNILTIPILSDTAGNKLSLDNVSSYNNGEIFTICFTGRIELKKEGFDLLYKALSVVVSEGKKVELHLYGSIDKRHKNILLNELPDKFGIKDAIHYHGNFDQKKIIAEMRKYHLLILPRPLTPQTDTGFSTKLSEYLVSGVPVLVTDVSDNALYIKDGVNGYIVQPGDVEIMAAKINNIIENYGNNTREIAENAFETAKKHFDYSNYSALLSEFMKN